MNENHSSVGDLTEESAQRGKDPKTRSILVFLVVLWLITLAALVGMAWKSYFAEKAKAQTLAQQISSACETGQFGPGLSPEDEEMLCSNAEKVIQNDPELQDEEIQNPELQEPEIQEPEIQDPEAQERENQSPERQDQERQDAEVDDPEVQDAENQDSEIQDAEVDDPDPNDQIQGGSCTFDGEGTFTITFETSSGPVTTTCTGTGSGNNGNGVVP